MHNAWSTLSADKTHYFIHFVNVFSSAEQTVWPNTYAPAYTYSISIFHRLTQPLRLRISNVSAALCTPFNWCSQYILRPIPHTHTGHIQIRLHRPTTPVDPCSFRYECRNERRATLCFRLSHMLGFGCHGKCLHKIRLPTSTIPLILIYTLKRLLAEYFDPLRARYFRILWCLNTSYFMRRRQMISFSGDVLYSLLHIPHELGGDFNFSSENQISAHFVAWIR